VSIFLQFGLVLSIARESYSKISRRLEGEDHAEVEMISFVNTTYCVIVVLLYHLKSKVNLIYLDPATGNRSTNFGNPDMVHRTKHDQRGKIHRILHDY